MFMDIETDLDGKNVLISGGTTGIGRAIALTLAVEGANVFIFGRHKKELNDALEDLHQVSDSVWGTTADQTKLSDLEKVFSQIDKEMGNLDILVNNAAVGAGGMLQSDIVEIDYVVKDNLLGYMYCTDMAISRMLKKGRGHIVNIGSMSADQREAESGVYVATKAAIQGYTEALRKELNPKGIKVTLIEPGLVGSDMVDIPNIEQKKLQKELKMLTADDIAYAVLFALMQPKRCDIVSMQIRPHQQFI